MGQAGALQNGPPLLWFIPWFLVSLQAYCVVFVICLATVVVNPQKGWIQSLESRRLDVALTQIGVMSRRWDAGDGPGSSEPD